MNIGVDIRHLGNEHFSGVNYYTYYLLEQLAIIDRDNTYYLFFNSARTNPRLPEPVLNNSQFHICRLKYPNKIINGLITARVPIHFDRIIESKFNTTLDLFWFPNPTFNSVSNKCNIITTVHDMSFYINPHFFSQRRRLWHHVTKPISLIERSQHIITISENSKNDILNFTHKSPQSISITPLGAHMTRPSQSEVRTVLNKYGIPNDFILFVGTLEPRKNIRSIIKAYNHIKTTHALVIIGNHGWKYKEILNDINKSHKKNTIFHFTNCSEQDKRALFTQCSLVLFPSFYEGFGLPALEGSLYNKPVITSVNSSLGEHVVPNRVYIDPNNVSQLTVALENILTQQNPISQLKNQVLYTWENTAVKTRSIFEKVLHNS